ncbi:hypothetical protein POL68_25525 [Stigmatella sp. ncwal1]|uniref:Uncharacterized protein n=1 Tax=Stigmatella ashevillensis TaxID=2995309 RepID=A0ABT5DDU7_9BACT|nr:hypothetical protein [Stigmatella ashevillena]MDC0711854.1 hypothetical protein [Stigmatella ashevillena]
MSLPRNVLSLLASGAFLLVTSCGGTAPEEAVPSQHAKALAACTARCSGAPSISCSGATCQSVDNAYVSCDGQRTDCPAAPTPCTVTLDCEAGGSLSCSGTSCQQLGPQSIKVCGGVQCDGMAQWCPPLPGNLECY